MPKSSSPPPKTRSPETTDPGDTAQNFGQADADLTARIDALQNAVKPKRPKVPPIGGMF